MHRTARSRSVAAAAIPLVFAASALARDNTSLPTLASIAERAAEPTPASAAIEAQLKERVELRDVLALVRARSPSLLAARARVRSALSSVKSATRLPDPALKGEIWGAPLLRPYALDESDTLMLGVKQEVPLTSFVDSKRDVAAAEAALQSASLLGDELDAERDVRAAFIRYRLAFEERALHEEHVRITEATIEALRAAQASGQATEADVSTARVALTMAHADLFTLDADDAAARAALNTWMARSADAPLGPPAATTDADVVGPARDADEDNDAVLRARAARAAADASARAANDDATLPTIMAGVDYWYMPARVDPHAYGAMLSVSLPWFNVGRAGDVEAARRRSEAASEELAATKLEVARVRAEVKARIDSDRNRLVELESEEIPAVEHNIDATKAAFAAGKSDARALLAANATLLDARIRRARLRAELALAGLDLARITGDLPTDSRSAP